MLTETLQLMPIGAFVAAFAVAFAAGIVKGAIGFGLPLLIMSGLSLFLEPRLAVAGVILPALVSNVLQVFRHSLADIRQAVRDYWRYIVIVCVMILISAQMINVVSVRVFYLVLGIPVLGISLIQLFGVRLSIPARRRRIAEWGIGWLAGSLGGLTGTWGPPTALYLMALKTTKMQQLLVQGVVYSLGAVSLVAGHLQSGILNLTTAPFSAILLVPMYLGMRVGFALGDRLNAEVFRRFTLIVLVLAGANLVRRGIFG